MEFVQGSLSGVFAGIFTNPLDVVKTRLQLQGELQGKGHHTTPYRYTLQAFYIIAKAEGAVALQKGLVPALWFQAVLNGTRLGSVDFTEHYFLDKSECISPFRIGVLGAIFGCVGSFLGSPFYLLKIRSQSQAAREIAVGYQHAQMRIIPALVQIYKAEGIPGLWRGSVSSLPRTGVGSAVQLATFSKTKEILEYHKILSTEKTLLNSFVASMVCGVLVAISMTPFDVIQTRMYNQGVDKNGKGLFYSGIIDCIIKTSQTEGLLGFFKGLGPCYLRIGPHSLLTLLCWDTLRNR